MLASRINKELLRSAGGKVDPALSLMAEYTPMSTTAPTRSPRPSSSPEKVPVLASGTWVTPVTSIPIELEASRSSSPNESPPTAEISFTEAPSLAMHSEMLRPTPPYVFLVTPMFEVAVAPRHPGSSGLEMISIAIPPTTTAPVRSIMYNSAATSAPTRALFFTRAMFALSDSPFVSCSIRANRNGVTSRPSSFCVLNSFTACRVAASTFSASAANSAWIGLARTTPVPRPSLKCSLHRRAASAEEETLQLAFSPDDGVKNAGKNSVPNPTTGTPCVSRYSSVFGISKIDFAPAQTTATGVLPSSVRSADTSQDSSAPRWTPPIPPVTKTRIPARCASNIVPATVVAPLARAASTKARSRRETLWHLGPSRPKVSNSSGVMPMHTTPSRMPMVAGVTP
mmetsp:Transcript_71469/g.190582  ORF Transcript_71469/g.190582 Transcript_71469/m.190582 type:complete len:398 (-) Transcript_71469:181-1374(-)